MSKQPIKYVRSFLQPLSAILAGCAIGFSIVGIANATPERIQIKINPNDSLMVDVPNFGPSRMETVQMCLAAIDVEKYQDIMTDWEFSEFEYCMTENT